MPVTPTYPGVYIEEIPSGVRTITGVATSITAFVGWAPKGPTHQAQLILSFSDYERQFGGLHFDSLMSYAVHHFFANGGQRGYVVRLAAGDSATATVTMAGLGVDASGPGVWANAYKIRIKRRTDDATRIRLEVLNGSDETVEAFENLSLSRADTRSAVSVIASSSTLISATVTDATQVPADQTAPLAGGADGAVLRPSTGPFRTALNSDGTGGAGGVHLLDRVDLFNLLCVAVETDATTLGNLQKRSARISDCRQR